MNNENAIVWFDSDLDGMCSYLAFCWLNGEFFPYKTSTLKKFGVDYNKWKTENEDKYDKIYILDMDISENAELIDIPKVTIIDHHETHLKSITKYKNAKTIVELCTSCTKLIIKAYKDKLSKLTKPHLNLLNYYQLAELKLLLLADDYDCYALKYPDSYKLNVVLWSLTGDRFGKFIKQFKDGFNGFTEYNLNSIRIHTNKLESLKKEIEIHRGTVKIGEETHQIVSTICEYALNEIADYLIEKYDDDICIIINPTGGYASFRRGKRCKIALNKLAEDLCDGGGHEYAAGGKLTDKFLEFTKLINQ